MLLNTYRHHLTEARFLYLVCLCIWLRWGLLVPCLYYIIIFIFVIINHIISLKLFCKCSRIWLINFSSVSTNNLIETCMKKTNSFQIAKLQPLCVPLLLLFFFSKFSLVLHVKGMLIKKVCSNFTYSILFSVVWLRANIPHALVYIARGDWTGERTWSFAMANPDVCESNQLQGSVLPCKYHPDNGRAFFAV